MLTHLCASVSTWSAHRLRLCVTSVRSFSRCWWSATLPVATDTDCGGPGEG